MRLVLLAVLLALALVAPACGGDDAEDPPAVQDEAQQPVEEDGAEATEARVGDVARETQQLVRDVTADARRLIADPDADVDERLAAAEDRARALSEQSRQALGEELPGLAGALADANDRLAEAAAGLRAADGRAEVLRIIREDLAVAGDRLTRGLGEAEGDIPEESRRELDAARTQLQELERAVDEAGARPGG
jgi:hypothetical protein